MTEVNIKTDPRVSPKLESYPAEIQPKINYLRSLLVEVASEIPNIGVIEETLKWGEPSYIAKKGSTIRMDWKSKNPDQYALYFKCTSKLVSTFKELYGTTFQYEKNRAILFDLDDPIPVDELKVCLRLALNYHNLKTLPRLGE